MMRFEAVVGNPPYQDETTGNSTQMPPIYHMFMESAYQLSNTACLITPARFLFNAGATPAAWNKKMLNDNHLKVLFYEQKSSLIFPQTDIKGGIAITFRDKNSNFAPIEVFTIYDELNTIIKRIDYSKEGELSSIISSAFSYQFSKELHVEHPGVANILSVGHANDITTGIFELLPDIFTEFKPQNVSNDHIQLYGLLGRNRVYRWVKRSYVKPHPNLDKYKVWVPKANGSGTLGEVLSTPVVGSPSVGTTHSFVSIGAFESKFEAESALKYVKTKFARALLGVLKITQDNPPAKWRKIPLQNFTQSSDIDWSKSIPEIDQQLYKKYDLSQEEINFIESRVKSMT